jgi:hypothetical protein
VERRYRSHPNHWPDACARGGPTRQRRRTRHSVRGGTLDPIASATPSAGSPHATPAHSGAFLVCRGHKSAGGNQRADEGGDLVLCPRNPSVGKIVSFLALVSATLACTSTSASTSKGLYRQTKGHVGESVTVDGFLIFEPENKNLYPSSNWHRYWVRKHCLPIGVLNSNDALASTLRQLSHRRVTVHGTIRVLVSQGEFTDSFCKDEGLMIDSVTPQVR